MKAKQVYLCTFSCSCVGCIQGAEDCSNTVCPEEWKGYDLGSQKNCEANRSWWRETAAGQIHKIMENTGAQQDIDWVARLNAMNAINNFDDLATYVSIKIHCHALVMNQMIEFYSRNFIIWTWSHFTIFQMMHHKEWLLLVLRKIGIVSHEP